MTDEASLITIETDPILERIDQRCDAIIKTTDLTIALSREALESLRRAENTLTEIKDIVHKMVLRRKETQRQLLLMRAEWGEE